MKHNRKILSALIAGTMAITSLTGGLSGFMPQFMNELTVSAETSGEKIDDVTGFKYVEVTDDSGSHIKVTDYDIENYPDNNTIVIPNEIDGLSVTEIAGGTFSKFTTIESITLPNTITEICASIFMDCSELNTLIIPDSVKRIYEYTYVNPFEKTSLPVNDDGFIYSGNWILGYKESSAPKKMNLDENVVGVAEVIFNDCKTLEAINVSEDNEHFSSEDGVLFNKDKTELVLYPNAKADTSYIVPDGVKRIVNNMSNNNLTDITVPYSVERMGHISGKTIHGYTNSAVHCYADKWGRNFVSIGDDYEEPDYTPNISNTPTYKKVDDDNDGEYDFVRITGCADKTITKIIIPDTIEGLPVKEIGDAAFAYIYTELRDISIPDTVECIQWGAFLDTYLYEHGIGLVYADKWLIDCHATVKNAIIKNGTVGIARCAFDCETSTAWNVETAVIPESVNYINDGAFWECSKLTDVTIKNPNCNISDDDFTISNGQNNGGYYNGVIHGYENSSAQAYAQKYGYNFEAIVTATSEEKVDDATGFKYVEITNGDDKYIKITGYDAQNHSEPETIIIPDTIDEIPVKAIAWDECSFKEVTIPADINEIDDNPFWANRQLETIIVDDENEYYTSVNGVLYDKNMTKLIMYPHAKTETEYIMPDTIKAIDSNALDNESIQSITISSGITDSKYISRIMLYNLKTVTLSEDNENFVCEDNIVYNKDKTELLLYPKGKTNISFVIPDTVKNINCGLSENIKNVTICDTIEDISFLHNMFGLQIIAVPSNSEKYSVEGGVLFNKDKTKLLCYPINKSVTGYTVPESVTTIGERAFIQNRNLVTTILPANVASIEKSAFYQEDKLKALIINNKDCELYSDSYAPKTDSVFIQNTNFTIYGKANSTAKTYAEAHEIAFEVIAEEVEASLSDYEYEKYDSNHDSVYDYIDITGMKNKTITNAVIPSEIEGLPVEAIEPFAFENCYFLESVTIPEGVKYILGRSFLNCSSLKNVNIPASVISVSASAFKGCTSLPVNEDGFMCLDNWLLGYVGDRSEAKTVTVDKEIKNIAIGDINTDYLTSITVDPDNTSFKSIDGVLFSKDGKTLLLYPKAKEGTSYTVPDGVVTVNNLSENVKTVTVPESVEFLVAGKMDTIRGYINSYAYYYADYYGKSFESIGTAAEKQYTPNISSTPTYEKIDDNGDGVYDSITITGCKDKTITKIIIPETIEGLPVKIIGREAFLRFKDLREVTIPNTVEYIAQNAFGGTYLYEHQTGLIYADKWLISCHGSVVNAEIKDGTVGIAEMAFQDEGGAYSDNVQTITIPKSVKYICEWGLTPYKTVTINNPDCFFYKCVSDDLTIHGYNNSTAQEYAEKYNCTFESLGDIPAPLSDQLVIFDAEKVKNGVVNAFTDSQLQITATASGNTSISYSSSDPTIAEVDNTATDNKGKITIKKAGTVTITATAEATSTYAEGTAYYMLIITEKAQPVSNANVESTPDASTGDTVYTGTGDAVEFDTSTGGNINVGLGAGNDSVTIKSDGKVILENGGKFTITEDNSDINSKKAEIEPASNGGTVTFDPNANELGSITLEGAGSTVKLGSNNAIPALTSTQTATISSDGKYAAVNDTSNNKTTFYTSENAASIEIPSTSTTSDVKAVEVKANVASANDLALNETAFANQIDAIGDKQILSVSVVTIDSNNEISTNEHHDFGSNIVTIRIPLNDTLKVLSDQELSHFVLYYINGTKLELVDSFEVKTINGVKYIEFKTTHFSDWLLVQSDDYNITITPSSNGTVSANKATAKYNDTITLTVTPNSNYKLQSLTVTKKGGGTVSLTNNKTFTMPTDDVTVSAVFIRNANNGGGGSSGGSSSGGSSGGGGSYSGGGSSRVTTSATTSNTTTSTTTTTTTSTSTSVSTSATTSITTAVTLGKVNTPTVDSTGMVKWTKVENAEKYQVVKIIDGKKFYGKKVSDTFYQFENLPEKDYSIYLLAFGKDKKNAASETVEVKVPKKLGTIRTPTINNGTISWKAVKNAASYKASYVANGKTANSKELTTTSYKFRSVPQNGGYEVYVTAYGENGQSVVSDKITVKKLGAISAPTLKNGTVTWKAVENAVSYKASYVANGKTATSKALTGASYKFWSAPKNGGYEVYVTAYGANGQYIRSEKTTVKKLGAISTPTFKNSTVTWKAVENAVNYKAYYSANGKNYASKALTTTSYKFLSAPKSGGYEVYVTAYGANGQYITSKKITVKKLGAIAAPTVNAGTVTWKKVENAVSYKASYVTNGKTATSKALTGTSYKFWSAPKNGGYDVYVTAYGANGQLIASNMVTVKKLGAISTPTVKNATVTWKPVENAVSYKAYYVANGKTAASKALTTTSYKFISAPKNGGYEVYVTAYGANGQYITSKRITVK